MPSSTVSSRGSRKYSEAFSSPTSDHSWRTLVDKPSRRDLSQQVLAQSSPSSDFYALPRAQSIVDTRDHSRLKACWDAMLSKRFLTSQVVNVLPLYLSSS